MEINKVIKAINTIDNSTVELNLEFVATLPFISISQAYGVGPTVTDSSVKDSILYNCEFLSVRSSGISKLKFNLVDDDTPDRYKAITYISSQESKNEYILFYDKKDKLFFLLPDISISIGDTPKTAGMLDGATLHLEVYYVGGNESSKLLSGLTLPVACKSEVFDEPTTIDYSYCKLLEIGGLDGLTPKHKRISYDSNGVNIYKEKPFYQFASLGNTTDLGVTKLPTYRMITTKGNPVFYYVGMRELDDVLIPIPK